MESVSGGAGKTKLTVLFELESDLSQDVEPMPVHLIARVLLRPPRSRDAALEPLSTLHVRAVEPVQLLLEFADLVLEVEQEAVVQGLEPAVHGFEWWWLLSVVVGWICCCGGAESRGDELVPRQRHSLSPRRRRERKRALVWGTGRRRVGRHVRLLLAQAGGIGGHVGRRRPVAPLSAPPGAGIDPRGRHGSAHEVLAFKAAVDDAPLRARAPVRLAVLDHEIRFVVSETASCRRCAPVRGRCALWGQGGWLVCMCMCMCVRVRFHLDGLPDALQGRVG